MSWLNNFLGDENKESALGDKDVASDLLMSSKNDITMLTKAVTEAANPQLRQILVNQLNSCINDHFQLADLSNQKNWYNAFSSPGQQIKQDLTEADNLMKQKEEESNQ